MELLTDQSESDRQFRLWVKAMVKWSIEVANGWVIEGEGVSFNNYGHGAPGSVENQIMLGVDPSTNSGVVKIVQPDVLQRDLGKLTAIGRDRRGGTFFSARDRFRKTECRDGCGRTSRT